MGLFVIILLVISAVILLISRRNTETILIAALNFSLAEFWYIMLIYISKKGGFTVQMEKLLFGTRAIRLKLQYLIFTLNRLGFVMAVGRFLFPLILMWLALYYSMRIAIERKKNLAIIAAVIPVLSLIIYYPSVFKWFIRRSDWVITFFVHGSLFWILLYMGIALILLMLELHDITIRFYRRQFGGRVMMILSLTILYGLYCPQDPAQVYLFYKNDFMGSRQGLWYLNPALNRGTYILVFILVIICTLVGVYSTLSYARENILEGIEENMIQRKFNTASKGASVFVHSVKNQLLANRILLKRTGVILSKDDPDLNLLRENYQQLSQNNEFMLERMEELYRSIRTNSIFLKEETLLSVCVQGIARFRKKYPDALVDCLVPENVIVLCDKNHLAEALYNLLSNGWEAQISAERTDKPIVLEAHEERLWTILEISDHGMGLSDKQRKHMFEPFWSSKNSNYNWGMGLYYVRQIVKSHLGTLRADTELGRGTTFTIQLPRYNRIHKSQEAE